MSNITLNLIYKQFNKLLQKTSKVEVEYISHFNNNSCVGLYIL